MERKINLFDKIGNLIPGYKGYVIRDEKRNTDKKFRDELVSKLNQSEEYLIRYQRAPISYKTNCSIITVSLL
jgi:hypothetical protein